MPRPLPGLRAQALALLARREQSRTELRSKLLQHAQKLAQRAAESAAARGATEPLEPPEPAALAAEVDDVLDWLAAKGLQSDARFVEGRVHARASRHGAMRIRLELSRHGLELDGETASRLKDSELSRAREVWRRRFGEPAVDAAGRAKQMRFLAARGFSGEVVRRVLGGRDDDEGL